MRLELWMPLYTDDIFVVGLESNALNDAVDGGPSFDGQAVCQPVDRLMVNGVDTA